MSRARCSGRCYHDRGHTGPCADESVPTKADDFCMYNGCNQAGTVFEEDREHWHDWVWCPEHASKRSTNSSGPDISTNDPLFAEIAGIRLETDK